MKKIVINLLLIITFFIIYFLHSNFFTWFKIAGIMPNLFVILILFIGLYAGKYMGLTYGIILGLFLDLFIGKRLGITAIMLGLVGIVGMIFDKNFSKDNRITLIVMVIIATLGFEIGEYILSYFINKSSLEIIPFIQMLVIEVLYNAMLTIILYPLMQKLGNKVETEYKGNNILTRYF